MNTETGAPLIETEQELDEQLSRPSEADVEAIARIQGDILILGVAGKMGPSLARLAARAAKKSGVKKRVVGVARFSNEHLAEALQAHGIETIRCDLLDSAALAGLPELENIVFMAARKFGTTGAEYLTWAMNAYLPGLVAERFRHSRMVAFSTGNVYPLRAVSEGGAIESTPTAPVGEYAQSALARERMFEYGSSRWRTPVVLLRLNYAVELRYGVLLDVALSVFKRKPVDLRMGLVNVIWQRDANSICLRSLAHCQSPPLILNLTGPETLPVRYIAEEFGRRFGIEPVLVGEEAPSALLNNAAQAHRLFGYPSVTPAEMMDWIAHWVSLGGRTLEKPTHFQVQDGRF
jgi:nucleoside-diphosphate-sugar epimerase